MDNGRNLLQDKGTRIRDVNRLLVRGRWDVYHLTLTTLQDLLLLRADGGGLLNGALPGHLPSSPLLRHVRKGSKGDPPPVGSFLLGRLASGLLHRGQLRRLPSRIGAHCPRVRLLRPPRREPPAPLATLRDLLHSVLHAPHGRHSRSVHAHGAENKTLAVHSGREKEEQRQRQRGALREPAGAFAKDRGQDARLLYVYAKESPNYPQINEWMYYITGFFYYISSTVNPILYNVMSARYRRAFRDTLCCPSRPAPANILSSSGPSTKWINGNGGPSPVRKTLLLLSEVSVDVVETEDVPEERSVLPTSSETCV
ncbi:hypothetical protein J437_LFUL007328 [Ladona fulva]|uniref:Uncharacterized protein n=1 Tax=Ladona fulva TaxID=123851 RepID=A0A8K0P370_LADFU|nr:hypothetical protein J437_LFUL007328 [Ladona fulva]